MNSRLIFVLLIATSLSASTTVALATGDCSDFIDLTGEELPITRTGTTAGASADYTPFEPESQAPGCWEGHWLWVCAGGPDVTYKWTAPVDGWYAISLVGSNYASDLLLYNFTCPEEPEFPDDFICGSHLMLQDDAMVTDLYLEAGQELLIVVDGFGQASGDYELTILDTNRLDDYLPFLMNAYHLPGLATVVVRDNLLCWSCEVGDASLEVGSASAVTDSTLFLTMCSCKPITGTALMQAWEGGLFALDDDVSDYLPFDFYHPDYPDVPITFRMLMCNVSGLADYYPPGFRVYNEDSSLSLADFMYGLFAPDGDYYNPNASFTDYAPGTTYEYSTLGIALLGYLIERMGPEPRPTFVDHCRGQLFGPLAMDRSSFMLSDIMDTQHLALPYKWNDLSFDVPSIGHPHVPWYPGMILRTSAEEMARFLLAIMNGGELNGEQIVAPATIDSMLTVQFPEVEITESPGGPAGHDQGLVWKQIDIDGREVWGALGDGWARACVTMFFSPAENIGAVMLANSGCADEGSFCTGGILILDALLDFAARPQGTCSAIQATSSPQPVLLNPCFPNPFNPQTTISFSLDRAQAVRLSVFDMAGRRVVEIADKVYGMGRNTVEWNGKDSYGRAVSSGSYLVRIEAGDRAESQKIMLVR